MKRFLLAAALTALAVSSMPAMAQSNRVVTGCGSMSPFASQSVGGQGASTVDPNGQGCVAASVSIGGGFTAAATGTPITAATGAGATGTLPAGTVVVATNVGTTNGAYCALGASASTSSQYLSPGGGWFAFQVGASTQLTCVTTASTTTVNMTGGSGLPTGTGGGGGGGGGGAITAASGSYASGAFSAGSIASGAAVSGAFADGAITSIGTEADAAWTSGSGTIIAILKGINATIAGNADPCNSATRTLNLPVAFSSATTTKIATGNTGQNLYVCELIGVPNGANNITLVSGNGSNCATNAVTVGGPWYLGNVGNGLDLGKGITSFAVTQATGYDICITTSTTATIAIQAITVLK